MRSAPASGPAAAKRSSRRPATGSSSRESESRLISAQLRAVDDLGRRAPARRGSARVVADLRARASTCVRAGRRRWSEAPPSPPRAARSGGRATSRPCRRRLQLGQLLLSSATGAKRSPCSSHALEHVARLEDEVGRLRGRLDLVPAQRAWTPWVARARAGSRRTRWSCARRSGSSRPAPCPCAAPSSGWRPPARGAGLQVAGQRLGQGLGLVVGGLAVQRRVDLHALRARGLGKALEPQLVEQLAQEQRHLAALHDPRRLAGVEVEGQRGRVLDRRRLRQRGVQLEVGQVGQPDQRGQVVAQAEVDRLAADRDRGRLDPLGPVRGALLLVEVPAVDPVGVALERQRAARAGAAARRAPRACSSRSPGPW